MELVKERSVRKYMVEKMHVQLARMWEQKQTNNKMYEYTSWQYERFLDKIDDLDEAILKLVPPNTHYEDVPCVTITD